MTDTALRELEQSFPQLKDVENEKELLWLNPHLRPAAEGNRVAPLSMADIDEAEDRLVEAMRPEGLLYWVRDRKTSLA